MEFNLQTVIDLLTLISTGFIAVFIAVGRLRIDKHKFRWEIYDRKLKIYISVCMILSKIREAVIIESEIFDFVRETYEADLLFGKEVREIIDKEIIPNAVLASKQIKKIQEINEYWQDDTPYPQEVLNDWNADKERAEKELAKIIKTCYAIKQKAVDIFKKSLKMEDFE